MYLYCFAPGTVIAGDYVSFAYSHIIPTLLLGASTARAGYLGHLFKKFETCAKTINFPFRIAFTKKYLYQENRFLSAGGKQGKEDKK